MISLFRYFYATRRLDECEKTIIMVYGSLHDEDKIPAQLAAQREMIKYEIEYYEKKVKFWGYMAVPILLAVVIGPIVLVKLGII